MFNHCWFDTCVCICIYIVLDCMHQCLQNCLVHCQSNYSSNYMIKYKIWASSVCASIKNSSLWNLYCLLLLTSFPRLVPMINNFHTPFQMIFFKNCNKNSLNYFYHAILLCYQHPKAIIYSTNNEIFDFHVYESINLPNKMNYTVSWNNTSDSAMMIIPRIIAFVEIASFGSYRCAVGINSLTEIMTIIPLVQPKSTP